VTQIPETRATRRLPEPVRWLVALAAVASAFLAMDALRMFGERPLLDTWLRVENQYYYALLALLLPPCFLVFAPTRGARRFWYDAVLAALALFACAYLFAHAELMLDEGWEFAAPSHVVWICFLVWGLTLEAVRRTGGTILFVLVALFSVYPIFAGALPGPIAGFPSSPAETAAYHVLSIESILGLPFRAFASLVIGFLLFGVALQHTGGGRFFIDLSFALFGHVRGGPAKVAIISSGLMGSMSGSVITNVLTTGQLTIPAMKRNGMRPDYAAGVEACASTGGVLLPPIMGSTAFVMATFLNVPYTTVALAAAVPAVLYFFGLFVQVDAYAARQGLEGARRDELPRLRDTLRDGWFYVAAFAALIFLLIVMQREAMAPFVATGALLLVNQLSPSHRWNWRQLHDFLVASGQLLIELLAVLAGVGLIVGALSMTGLSGTLVNDLLYLAGDSTLMLLMMGAATSFVLGIGMTVTAAYIFLAIILAPALIQGGLDPLSVHLFILYWGMLSFITPPVALGAFAAASIAGSSALGTGFRAMHLGSVIYFIPFFFVLDTSLILRGSAIDILLAVAAAVLGIVLIAAALQGYLIGLRRPLRDGAAGLTGRALMALGGVLVALPGMHTIGIPIGAAPLLVSGLLSAGLGISLARKSAGPLAPIETNR
jgi:TRAP transporter 4TM/12TM fusion protein